MSEEFTFTNPKTKLKDLKIGISYSNHILTLNEAILILNGFLEDNKSLKQENGMLKKTNKQLMEDIDRVYQLLLEKGVPDKEIRERIWGIN